MKGKSPIMQKQRRELAQMVYGGVSTTAGTWVCITQEDDHPGFR